MPLKKLYIISCVVWLLCACGEKATYRVELDLSNLETQNLYAVFESDDHKQVDTVVYPTGKTFQKTNEEGQLDPNKG